MSGIDVRFNDNSSKILKELESKKEQSLEAIGIKATSIWTKIITLKDIVDTGRFRNSTEYKVNGNEVYIGSKVEYSTYLELGTHKMPARPSLRPAIMDYVPVYEQLIEEIYKK